jgi:PE-PPE domain
MFGRGVFRLGLGVSAAAVASVLGMNAAVGHADDTALIVGGSAAPTPPQSYVDATQNLYLNPLGYGSYTPVPLTTPEQYYPITGPYALIADASVAQGVTITTDAVNQQVDKSNKVVVFGYSQGASVVSQTANALAHQPNPPRSDQVSFVLLGNPDSPNGGLNTRFQIPGAPPLTLMGVTYNQAPTGTQYPTTVYNQEYDAAGDFPQYPLNFVSDLNATLGFFTQHIGYLDLTPQQINSAVKLATTGGNTTYYMVPTANLPLLAPVRLIPLIGNPLADLLQPDLKVIVNLGYGSIDNGWSPGPANVPTPIGVFPTNINPTDVVTALVNGIPQGITNALNDLANPQLLDLSPLSLFLSGINTLGWTPSPTPSLTELLGAFAIVGNNGLPVSSSDPLTTLSNVASYDLASLRPLADTVTAFTVTLPQYNAQVFTSQLAAGNPLGAVGLPLAVDLGLAPWTLATGVVFPALEAVATTVTQVGQLTGLVPNPSPPAASPLSTTAPVSTPPVNTNAAVNTPSTPPSTSPPKGVGLGPTINNALAPITNALAPITNALTPKAPVTPPKTTAPVNQPKTTAPLNLTPPSPPSTPKPTGTLGTASPAAVTPHPVSAVTGAGAGKNEPSGTRSTGTDTGNARNTTGGTGLHRTHG